MTIKATCMVMTRRDGVVLRATTLDRDIEVVDSVYGGLYSAGAAIITSAFSNNASMAVDDLEVSGAMTATRQVEGTIFVTPDEIETGLYDGARVQIFEVDPEAPDDVRILLNGPIGQISRTYEGSYKAEARNLLQLLQQNIGERYSVTCRAVLGSGAETPAIKRCGVNLPSYAVVGTITSVDRDRYAWTDTSLLQDPNYFRDGIVAWVTGNNAGYRGQIRRHLVGGQIVLCDGMPRAFQVGDAYSLTPGCNKLFATCRDKFNNAANFRGEYLIPGIDAIIAGEGSE